MGIITELAFAARIAAAEKANDEEALRKILKEQQELHEYRLRGERRVARFFNRLFGWKIPDELNDDY